MRVKHGNCVKVGRFGLTMTCLCVCLHPYACFCMSVYTIILKSSTVRIFHIIALSYPDLQLMFNGVQNYLVWNSRNIQF